MKKLFVCSLLALFSASTHAIAALQDQIPADTLAVLHIRNVPSLSSAWNRSPMGEAFAAFEWAELLQQILLAGEPSESGDEETTPDPASLRRHIEEATENWSRFHPYLSGEALFVIGDLADALRLTHANKALRETLYEDIDWEKEGEDPAFDAALQREMELDARETLHYLRAFLCMAEVRDGSGLLAFLEKTIREDLLEQEAGDQVEELLVHDWKGLPVYSLATRPDEDADERTRQLLALEPSIWYTVSNGVLYLTLSEEGLRDALERQTNPPASRLPELATLTSADASTPMDIGFLVNFPRLDALLRIPLGTTGNDPSSTPSPTQFLDWLSLDALLPYIGGLRVGEEGLHTRGRFGFRRETPLSRLLLDPSEAPAPTPPFVHRNLVQVSTAQWSLGRFLTTLEQELASLSPGVATRLAGARMAATGLLGVDIKAHFLDQIASEFLLAQDVDVGILHEMLDLTQSLESPEDLEKMAKFQRENPTNGQYILLALEIKDREVVSGFLQTLAARLNPQGPKPPEEYKGVTLHFPLPDRGESGPSPKILGYTFLENHLLVSLGNPHLLRQAIDAHQDPALRLWTDPAYQDFHEKHAGAPGQMLEYASGRAQDGAATLLQRSLGTLLELRGGTLPDIRPLVSTLRRVIGVTRRLGLLYETEGFLEYGPRL